MPARPHFGHTRAGLPVHAHVRDHLPARTRADRINKWLAVRITAGVGSMWCAYLFGCIALISLPSALASGNVITIVSWVAQTFLQLVLLSVIIVGQTIQAQASDARAARTFEDAEQILAQLGEVRKDFAMTVQAITGRLGGDP